MNSDTQSVYRPEIRSIPGCWPDRYGEVGRAKAGDLIKYGYGGCWCYFRVIEDGRATIGLNGEGGWPPAGINTERYARTDQRDGPIPTSPDSEIDWR